MCRAFNKQCVMQSEVRKLYIHHTRFICNEDCTFSLLWSTCVVNIWFWMTDPSGVFFYTLHVGHFRGLLSKLHNLQIKDHNFFKMKALQLWFNLVLFWTYRVSKSNHIQHCTSGPVRKHKCEAISNCGSLTCSVFCTFAALTPCFIIHSWLRHVWLVQGGLLDRHNIMNLTMNCHCLSKTVGSLWHICNALSVMLIVELTWAAILETTRYEVWRQTHSSGSSHISVSTYWVGERAAPGLHQ